MRTFVYTKSEKQEVRAVIVLEWSLSKIIIRYYSNDEHRFIYSKPFDKTPAEFFSRLSCYALPGLKESLKYFQSRMTALTYQTFSDIRYENVGVCQFCQKLIQRYGNCLSRTTQHGFMI